MGDFGKLENYNFIEIGSEDEKLKVIISPWNGEYHTVLGIRTYVKGMHFDKLTKDIPLDFIGDFVQSLRTHFLKSSFEVKLEVDNSEFDESSHHLIITLVKK